MTAPCSSPGDIGQAGDTCPVPPAPGVQGGDRALGAAVGRGLALPPALHASRRKAEEFIITFPLAVHLFISSNVPGLEKVFEQEPPPQQMAGGNVNTPHTQQWWEPCAAPRAGSQLCLPSQHPEPPRFCRPDAVFLFLFSPLSSSSTSPAC